MSIPSASASSEQIIEFQKSESLSNLMSNGMINNWVRCSGDKPGIIENSDGTKFYIPPKSTFHVGDVKDIEQYSRAHG